MTVFQIIAILISLTAIFSYLNFRFFKLPATIGVMLIALLASLAVIGAGIFAPWVREGAEGLLRQIDFDETLMQGMLCFLLFAGALHINLTDLGKQKGVIGTLAIAGVVISIFVFFDLKKRLTEVGCLLSLTCSPGRTRNRFVSIFDFMIAFCGHVSHARTISSLNRIPVGVAILMAPHCIRHVGTLGNLRCAIESTRRARVLRRFDNEFLPRTLVHGQGGSR